MTDCPLCGVLPRFAYQQYWTPDGTVVVRLVDELRKKDTPVIRAVAGIDFRHRKRRNDSVLHGETLCRYTLPANYVTNRSTRTSCYTTTCGNRSALKKTAKSASDVHNFVSKNVFTEGLLHPTLQMLRSTM